MIANSEYLDATKKVSIQDAVNVVLIVLRDLKNLLKLSKTRKSMLLNGKDKTKKKDLNKVVVGMKEIWKNLDKCLWKLPKNILILKMEGKKQENDLLNGIKIILKKDEYMIEQCMQSKQENLYALKNVLSAKKNVLHTPIMRTIQNLMMLFGFVQDVILTYITNQNITLNDLTRKLRKEMRKSEHTTKACEADSKKLARLQYNVGHKSNRMWQAGGKARFIYLPPGYNNDPLETESQQYVDLKSFLMDLNILTRNGEDNKAQAEQFALAA